MHVMHTAILYTSNTADQAVNTVLVQLGAARYLTRPLTVLFYTVNFTTYSSKVDYTMLTLVPKQDTIL